MSNSTAPTPTLEAEQDRAASCFPELSIYDLRKAAARGSIDALSLLCSRALDDVTGGVLEYDDGLSAAEAYASLAAAAGGSVERWSLVTLLLHRAQDHKASGQQETSTFYEREASRHLRKLHASGDAEAAATLSELEASHHIDHDAEQFAEQVEATLARAARGDAHALSAIIDNCLMEYSDGAVQPTHALALSEAVARLAAHTGETRLITKLAGVLSLRGFYEREHGARDRAAVALCEAVAVALFALKEGDEGVASALSQTLDEMPPPLLPIVIQTNPGALMFSTIKGQA